MTPPSFFRFVGLEIKEDEYGRRKDVQKVRVRVWYVFVIRNVY